MPAAMGDPYNRMYRLDSFGTLHHLGIVGGSPRFGVIDNTLYISTGELFKFDGDTKSFSVFKDFNLEPAVNDDPAVSNYYSQLLFNIVLTCYHSYFGVQFLTFVL